MALKLGSDHAKMWKDFLNFYFIVITSGLLYLMLLVTSEPVCYTRVSLDERNGYMKRVNCDGTDKICHRFASSEDVNLGVLLNSPCEYPEDYPSTHGKIYEGVVDAVWFSPELGAITLPDPRGLDILSSGGTLFGHTSQLETMCSTNNLPNVAEGSFHCALNTDVSMGEACTLACNDGFYPVYSRQAVCEEDITHQGVWSDGRFVCHEITCSTNNLPIVEEGSFDCAPNTNISMGVACTLTCNDGWYPAYSIQAVCEEEMTNQGGVWSDGSFTCLEITCSTNNLPIVEEGSFDCAPNTNISKGEVCYLTCNDGWYPAYSSRAVCEEEMTNQGGVWSDGSFTCLAIKCSTTKLPTVSNGSFDCAPNSNLSMGEACNLTCNNGFYPVYSNQAVCEVGIPNQGGVWSNGTFMCRLLKCFDWNEWNGSEYKFTSTQQTWEESGQLCESDNSHLVTTKNKEENEFVYKMVWHCGHYLQMTWIGLSDRNTEGTWEWSDGTVSTYRNWYEGQPDGGDGDDCVRMNGYSGEWYDERCTKWDQAVCERNNTLT